MAAKAADFYSGSFYQQGIEDLVECWEEVVNNNGEYIIDLLVVIFCQTFKKLNFIKGGNLVANNKWRKLSCRPNIYTHTCLHIYMCVYIIKFGCLFEYL